MSGLNLFTHGITPVPGYGAMTIGVIKDPNGVGDTLGTVRIHKNNSDTNADFLSTCLITRIRHNKEVAFSAEPTISGDLYLNYFGNKPTSYTVSGIAFDSIGCNESPAGEPLTDLYKFYEDYKLKAVDNIQECVTITTYHTLHGTAKNYTGLLTGMDATIALADPNGTRQYEFNLSFLALN